MYGNMIEPSRIRKLQEQAVKRCAPVDTLYFDVHNIPVRCGAHVFDYKFLRLVPAWPSKDERVTPLAKMRTEHIRRCIAMIFIRSDGWRHQWLQLLTDELKKRSDHE